MKPNESTQLFVDSFNINLNIPVFHGRIKHLKIKFFFLRDNQQEREVKLFYCKTKEQLADILTKALPNWEFAMGVSSFRVKKENC